MSDIKLDKKQIDILRYLCQHHPQPNDGDNSPHRDDPQWESYIDELKELGLIDFKRKRLIDFKQPETNIRALIITTIGLQSLRKLEPENAKIDPDEKGLRQVTHFYVGWTYTPDQDLVWFELKYQEPIDTQPVHRARFAVTPQHAIDVGKLLIVSGDQLLQPPSPSP